MEIEITFILNNQIISTQLNPATVLLDFIRKNKRLTGTKEVCKEGDCGACAVLLGEIKNGKVRYKVINSCLFPILKVKGKHVVTIEGLNQEELNPIQTSFLNEGASQCGFCTPGFIISFTGYLLNTNKFIYDEAINSIAGNICRCTGYHSILKSIKNVVKDEEHLDLSFLINKKIIPQYFNKITEMLKNISKNNETEKKRKIDCHTLISGGTDLFVQQADYLLESDVDFIENIVKPNIELKEDKIIISGSATVEDLNDFLKLSGTLIKIDKLFRLFASLPIRNSATIAGNIVNASPIADITITLLALNAQLALRNSSNSQRIIPLNKFYKGYKTLVKKDDEIIESISFDIPDENSFFNFEKVSKRTHLDIASVNSAILINIENKKTANVSLSVGGVAPIPLYLEKTSSFLENKILSESLILETIEIALSEISPISDIRGSAEYKSLLTQQLIKAHFIELFPSIISSEVLV